MAGDNVVRLPPRPTEWDELFNVTVARNGQIIMEAKDGVTFPEPLVWALADICGRMIEFREET